MSAYKYRLAPPRANSMIESLRGLGYSAATALADIIDNSIAARARNIDISFLWNADNPENSCITILDDGSGMNDHELERAMRLGDKSPLEERDSDDLGRFGLGLKTASFSQCRGLTVASRKGNQTSCLRWDLDILSRIQNGEWHLLEGPEEDSEAFLKPVDSLEHGTLVLLQKLDRIITPGFDEQDLLDLIDSIEKHLAMVFHRYLAKPGSRLKLSINGKPLSAWDPFLLTHDATYHFSPDRLPGGIEVQGIILPHKDRLSTVEYEQAGGLDGWTAQQGFYVYRNERLLVAGSWLGLGHGRAWIKEEAHRLARIRLDIPNTADAEWKIDIRKSTARPPVTLKPRLTHLAEDVCRKAREVFAHRGISQARRSGQEVSQAWRAEHYTGGIRYRIEHDHPAIKTVLEEAGTLSSQIKAMLRVIEETVPVQRIWLDTAEGKETPRTGFAGAIPDEVTSILEIMYRNMIFKKGVSPPHAREILLHTEPFHNYPELVAALPDNPLAEGR